MLRPSLLWQPKKDSTTKHTKGTKVGNPFVWFVPFVVSNEQLLALQTLPTKSV